MEGDEAFYYLHDTEGSIKGAMITHIDDFTIAGNANFIENILKGILETLTVSQMEKDKFRFTSWDVEKYEDQVKVSMKDYANRLKEIKNISKADKNEALNKLEFRKYFSSVHFVPISNIIISVTNLSINSILVSCQHK